MKNNYNEISFENTELLVLQPTSLCNLNCRYCYVPERTDSVVMSQEVLESTFKLFFSAKKKGHLDILYHAGEPLTVGINFYQKALDLISKYKSPQLEVSNVIQTNGVLLNKTWIEFLRNNRFKVGISIDGPEFLHNENRKSWSGIGSYTKTMRGYYLLKEGGLNPGVLTVLTAKHFMYPDELFNFYIDNKITSVGFNIEEIENVNKISSIAKNTSDVNRVPYKKFMERIIELWLKHIDIISFREISDLIDVILDKKKDINFSRIPFEVKNMGIITVQKNGDITTYSPEFAGEKSEKYKNFIIGNVTTLDNLEDILSNSTYLTLKKDLENRKSKCKETCTYYDFCGSAFASNVYAETGALDTTESIGCILHRQVLTDLVISEVVKLSKAL